MTGLIFCFVTVNSYIVMLTDGATLSLLFEYNKFVACFSFSLQSNYLSLYKLRLLKGLKI
jgi:hypothetical protein